MIEKIKAMSMTKKALIVVGVVAVGFIIYKQMKKK